MKQILTKKHERFQEFVELLMGPEGIDPDPSSGGNFSVTKKILEKHFPEIDIDATIEYFEANGGYCDTEVLLNIGLS